MLQNTNWAEGWYCCKFMYTMIWWFLACASSIPSPGLLTCTLIHALGFKGPYSHWWESLVIKGGASQDQETRLVSSYRSRPSFSSSPSNITHQLSALWLVIPCVCRAPQSEGVHKEKPALFYGSFGISIPFRLCLLCHFLTEWCMQIYKEKRQGA